MSLPDFTAWRVDTAEDAQRLIRAQLERVARQHVQTFVMVPTADQIRAAQQREDYARLMLEYGIAVGLIEMAHKSGKLNDEGYRAMRLEALQQIMPGVVGVVDSVLR